MACLIVNGLKRVGIERDPLSWIHMHKDEEVRVGWGRTQWLTGQRP